MPRGRSRTPPPIAGKTLHPSAGAGQTKKATIPVAFREQIWLREFGKVFDAKCPIPWCQNTITVYDFESGHNIPESKGGKTTPDNLIPICSRCNKSMGNRYTIDEWKRLGALPATAVVPEVEPRSCWKCC